MKLENNLDTDHIRELVWKLAFPSMLAQFVSVLYSIVDRMYIGNIPQIGAPALAAVGVCGPVADHLICQLGGDWRSASYEHPAGTEK